VLIHETSVLPTPKVLPSKVQTRVARVEGSEGAAQLRKLAEVFLHSEVTNPDAPNEPG